MQESRRRTKRGEKEITMQRKPISEYTADDLGIMDVAGDEQETTISWYRRDAVAVVWTSDNTMLTKMKKLMAKSPDCKLKNITWSKDGEPTGYFFEVPVRFVKVLKPKEVSEEQRAALSERLKARKELGRENDD